MKRCIIQTTSFTRKIKDLLKKRKLLSNDFELFKHKLANNPETGDLISGTSGIRKTRLKSSTKGTSGGFRVCYFYHAQQEKIFLILVYQKNEQENLTIEEKKVLKALITIIKAKNHE